CSARAGQSMIGSTLYTPPGPTEGSPTAHAAASACGGSSPSASGRRWSWMAISALTNRLATGVQAPPTADHASGAHRDQHVAAAGSSALWGVLEVATGTSALRGNRANT